MSSVGIRVLDPGEARAFHALRLRGVRSAPAFFRISVDEVEAESIEYWAARLASPNNRVVGAYLDDRFVGIGGITRLDGTKLRHKALLWGMFVVPEAAGLGVGAQIVESLIGQARGFVESLHLTLAASNDRALALYQRCGFGVFGREPQSILQADGLHDELLMWRPVGDK